MSEELGCPKMAVKSIVAIDKYKFRDKELGRTWVRHIFLAEISTSDVHLDWEHSDYRWVEPREIGSFDTTPGLARDLAKVISATV